MTKTLFFCAGSGGGDVCVAGRIETGYIQKNDTVLIAPLNETATVKSVSLDVGGIGAGGGNNAFAGDHVSVSLSGADQTISKGMLLCDPASPVRVSCHFAAKMVVFKMDNMQPITKVGCFFLRLYCNFSVRENSRS